MYKQIPAYAKPIKKETDPCINTTFLDLTEIHSISVPHPDIILSFDKRDYIEITVTSKGKEKAVESYIINKSKKLECAQVNSAGPIEKQLSFQAVEVVTIDGYIHEKNEKE